MFLIDYFLISKISNWMTIKDLTSLQLGEINNIVSLGDLTEIIAKEVEGKKKYSEFFGEMTIYVYFVF